MIPRIDSHQHFWHYTRTDYGWIDDNMAALRADFLPRHLQPLLVHSHVDACIAVQARQSLDETRFLLQLADENPWIRGVVGWVDLQSKGVDAQLREFLTHRAFVGVRHIVQAEAEDFLRRPAFRRGVAGLAAHRLVYELLVYPHQLPAAIELVASLPQVTFVLDHLAKPYAARGDRQPWARDLGLLAQHGNVHCKLSGLVTEADWKHWTPAALQPYFAVALDVFGPERVMFGSDWPVCTLACSYRRWCEIVDGWLQPLLPALRQAILGGNAARVYRLAG
jgi:L-fuconolactonase